MKNSKRITISRKFSSIALIVSIITIVIAYFTLNYYKSTMIHEVYTSTQTKLIHTLDDKIDSKPLEKRKKDS